LKLFLPLALLVAIAAPAAAADEPPAPEAVPYAVGTYGGPLPITTPQEAHDAVLAAGGPFEEFVYNDGALIGADKYYDVKGEAGSDAIWIVVYTYGWNDCEAGCINSHSFVYQVDPVTGAASFDSHRGDELAADAPSALIALAGRGGGVVPIPEPEWRTLTGEPTACPEGITDPSASISSDTVLPCLLPDGSLFPVAMLGGTDGEVTDWATLYETWMREFSATLEPCGDDVDTADPNIAPCLLPDGTAVGMMPLFAADTSGPKTQEGDSGWTKTLPMIVLAVLLAWIGAAALVGRSKRRAA